MGKEIKIGEILVAAGVIDEKQLAAALGEQVRWGRRLGVTLIKMGMVEEIDFVRALAKQLDLPIASLAGKRISDDVIALVPLEVASEHSVIPLFVKQREGRTKQLYLGMEDPSDLAVLDDLSFRTGMEIITVLVGPSEIGEGIDRYYLGSASNGSGNSRAKKPTKKPTQKSAKKSKPEDDEMSETNLHLVMEEEAPTDRLTLASKSDRAIQESEVLPASRDTQLEFVDPPVVAPGALVDEVKRAFAETEQTRQVAKALIQLLIEKGVISLEEIQERITQQKSGASS